MRFVKPPLVVANDSGNVQVWVRLNRPLRDNEGSLGELPDFGSGIEIPETTADIPGLYRDDLHPTCNGQFLFGDVADGERVSVALVLGPSERIEATAPAQAWQTPDVDRRALRRLGRPSDHGVTRRCRRLGHGALHGWHPSTPSARRPTRSSRSSRTRRSSTARSLGCAGHSGSRDRRRSAIAAFTRASIRCARIRGAR